MLPHLFPWPITISSLFCSASPPRPFPTAPDCQEIPPAAARSVTAPQSYLLMAYMSTMVPGGGAGTSASSGCAGLAGGTRYRGQLCPSLGCGSVPPSSSSTCVNPDTDQNQIKECIFFFFFKVFLKQQVLICYQSVLQQSAA